MLWWFGLCSVFYGVGEVGGCVLDLFVYCWWLLRNVMMLLVIFNWWCAKVLFVWVG